MTYEHRILTWHFKFRTLHSYIATVKREIERARETRRNDAFMRCLERDAAERRAWWGRVLQPFGTLR